MAGVLFLLVLPTAGAIWWVYVRPRRLLGTPSPPKGGVELNNAGGAGGAQQEEVTLWDRAGRRAINAADSITAKQRHNLSLEVQPGEAVVEGQAGNGVQRSKAAKQQQRQQYEVAVVQPGEAVVV